MELTSTKTERAPVGRVPTATEKDANLKLWESHRRVSEDKTKKVSYGKRNFTAIDPYYLIQMATELWGPYGATWGCDIISCDVINPAPDTQDPSMVMLCRFWYPQGEFNIQVDDKFKPSQDTSKKLQTNAMSKGLSKLGFAADVYLGLFEDEMYVRSLKEDDTEEGPLVTQLLGRISKADEEGLAKAEKLLNQWSERGTISNTQYAICIHAIANRRAFDESRDNPSD